jgi:hypothetical protein
MDETGLKKNEQKIELSRRDACQENVVADIQKRCSLVGGWRLAIDS